MNDLKTRLKTKNFKIFLAASVLIFYFNAISKFMNIYLVDCAQMAFIIIFIAIILRGWLKNIVTKFKTPGDFKKIFEPTEPYGSPVLEEERNQNLSRAQRRELERKKQKGRSTEDNSTAVVISGVIIVGIIGLLILSKINPGLGTMIFKPSSFLVAVFIFYFYMNYEELIVRTETIYSKKIMKWPAVGILLLNLIIFGVSLYFLRTHNKNLGILLILTIINIKYFYLHGLRHYVGKGLRTVTDVLAGILVAAGLLLLLTTFGLNFMQNILILGGLYLAFIFGFNINSKYLYGLAIFLVLTMPVLHFVYFNLAEYFAVLTFYLMLVGVLGDLFREYLYVEDHELALTLEQEQKPDGSDQKNDHSKNKSSKVGTIA